MLASLGDVRNGRRLSRATARAGRTRAVRPIAADRKIIEGCRRGDTGCWNALIGLYQKSVYRFAYALARNHDDAGDIAAQAFVRVYENLHTFRYESSFSSWVFRIVRNIYYDTCARAPHRAELSLDDPLDVLGNKLLREAPDPAPSPEQRYLESERARILDGAIRHLPRYQRAMVVMYHTEGRTYEEIARRMELPVGTVKSRLSRARQMLRNRLACMEEALVSA